MRGADPQFGLGLLVKVPDRYARHTKLLWPNAINDCIVSNAGIDVKHVKPGRQDAPSSAWLDGTVKLTLREQPE